MYMFNKIIKFLNPFNWFKSDYVETAEIIEEENDWPGNSMHQKEAERIQRAQNAIDKSYQQQAKSNPFPISDLENQLEIAKMMQAKSSKMMDMHLEMEKMRHRTKSGHELFNSSTRMSPIPTKKPYFPKKSSMSTTLEKVNNILNSKTGVAIINDYVFDVSRSYSDPKGDITLYVICQDIKGKMTIVTSYPKVINISEILFAGSVPTATVESILNYNISNYAAEKNISNILTFENRVEPINNLCLKYSSAIDGYFSLYTLDTKKNILDFKDVNDFYNLFKKEITMDSLIKSMKDE